MFDFVVCKEKNMFTLQVQSGGYYPILSYLCSQALIKELRH